MKELPNKINVNVNLNDNAKKVTIFAGVVIVLIAFFRLISNIRRAT